MELLVVIAIISILASLLLPALAKAQAQALLSSCASQLKQQGLGMHMYANEEDDRLPGSPREMYYDVQFMIGTNNPFSNWPWYSEPYQARGAYTFMHFTRDYLNIKTNADTGDRIAFEAPAHDVLWCPSIGKNPVFTNANQIAYGMSLGGTGWMHERPSGSDAKYWIPFFSRNRLGRGMGASPSRIFLSGDRFRLLQPASSATTTTEYKRAEYLVGHGNRFGNVLALDGSVAAASHGRDVPLNTEVSLTSPDEAPYKAQLALPTRKYYVVHYSGDDTRYLVWGPSATAADGTTMNHVFDENDFF